MVTALSSGDTEVKMPSVCTMYMQCSHITPLYENHIQHGRLECSGHNYILNIQSYKAQTHFSNTEIIVELGNRN